MELYFTLIGILLIILVFPTLGKKIYKFSTRKLLFIYLISISILCLLNIVFAGSFDPNNTVEILAIYINLTSDVEILFFFMLGFYITGGLGLFGSLAEISSETIEDSFLFANLKKKASPKAYFSYMIYGYLFALGVYSASKIFIILLGIEIRPELIFFKDIFLGLQFESIILVIIGITLWSIKSFKYGYFSKEYWKSGLSYQQTRDTWYRYLRKFIVVFFYSWGIYVACITYIIEAYHLTTPFNYGDFDTIQIIYYFSILFESIYFYKNKGKIVEHLRVQQKDFAKKEDKSLKVEEEVKPTKDPFLDEDIKFK